MAAEAPLGLRIVLHKPLEDRVPVHVFSHTDRDQVLRQTVLVQDENQSLENALRTLLQELVVATPAAETDGGSGAELEDGAAPAAFNITHGEDMTPEDGTKQSPDINMGQETGQSEAEAEAKPNIKVEAESELSAESETNAGTTD